MKDYLSRFDPHLSGLTGDPAAVAKTYGVYYKKVPLDQGGYTMDHTAIAYQDGRPCLALRPQADHETAAADLRQYL
jgi:protein SCO1/2